MILLVSNSRDFATDFIVAQLLERDIPYFRIDLDLLSDDRVELDPLRRELFVSREGTCTTISSENTKSILFRAPTHLRESSGSRHASEDLLARHQWAAFARSLMLFENSTWINHPACTYKSESKPCQLAAATKHGFAVPHTLVSNSPPSVNHHVWGSSNRVALKALDTFLVRLDEDKDAFFYTQSVDRERIQLDALSSMPAILQRYMDNKIDIRATVVGQRCFVVSVLVDGAGISGDWRLAKNQATFRPIELPRKVESQCISLVRELGLVFGAIDLVLVDDEYYFLEVNPTGEWAWLVTQCDLRIDHAIADELAN